MPNTKSAEKRMRGSARKQANNKRSTSRLKTVEKSFLALVQAGKKEDAAKELSRASSVYDKAAKTGVIPKATANRKKSRLALKLKKLAAPAPAAS